LTLSLDATHTRTEPLTQCFAESRLKGNLDLPQDTDCAALAHEIELALYEENNQDAGQKYKTKYRAIHFNLKDPRNNVLYKYV
jgi:hypothetical protein